MCESSSSVSTVAAMASSAAGLFRLAASSSSVSTSSAAILKFVGVDGALATRSASCERILLRTTRWSSRSQEHHVLYCVDPFEHVHTLSHRGSNSAVAPAVASVVLTFTQVPGATLTVRFNCRCRAKTPQIIVGAATPASSSVKLGSYASPASICSLGFAAAATAMRCGPVCLPLPAS